jgi:small subunit ribosomal protein S15
MMSSRLGLAKRAAGSLCGRFTCPLSAPAVRCIGVLSQRQPVLTAPQPTVPHQQQRFRWTKAKKKRFARHDLREILEQQGKPLPKPPYFFPKDTPVVNAISAEEREVDRVEHDLRASEDLQARRVMQQEEGKTLARHHFSGVPMSDRVAKLFNLQIGNQKEVVMAQKQRGMELFQLREGDTGSSAVQVIALTARVQQMQTHMSSHKKDKHSKRGMDAIFSRRRKLLDYMERKDFESYRRVVKTLGLNR